MSEWVSKQDVVNKTTGAVREYYIDNESILVKFDRGTLRINVFSGNIIRFTFTSRDKFLDIPSFAVIKNNLSNDFIATESAEIIEIKASELNINIHKNNGSIKILDKNGNVICDDYECGIKYTKKGTKCSKKIRPDEHYYGLGEKTGFLDKKGKKYRMWNTDDPIHTPDKDPLYKSIPFLICLNKISTYGVFVDYPGDMCFDLGEENEACYSFEVTDAEVDYYFIYGPDIKNVISSYTDLTGKMELPPLWALGYQQCKWSYYPDSRVLEIADKFRERDIPCDVIYLDIDYMDEYRVFTWDAARFPSPEDMLKTLKDKGFKLVTIVDPGVKKDSNYDVYLDGVKKGVFCELPTGEVYHGKVWPGTSAFPDFTKEVTRKWWGQQHKALIGKGVAGIWNDMNEPSDFAVLSNDKTLNTVPGDVMMDNDGYPRNFDKYHNAYGFNMCKGTFEGFKELKPEERPFIVTRSAYAGIQRYSAVWTGDNHSWWEHIATSIPMHLNIGLSGVPFVGGDVGGFQGNATPELFARWMQLGTFTPFLRAHTEMTTKDHEPWVFGEQVEDICRKYIKLRYRFLPYIYNEFYKSSNTGLPMMRPLVLEYPHDEEVHNLSDQLLFGENIMVAPVYRPSLNKRCVYIPEGEWCNWWTGEVIEGKKYILEDAPLEIMPIYIKKGSIIPLAPEMNYVGEKQIDELTLVVFPDEYVKYSFYEDDGISNSYKEGCYSLTDFEVLKTHESITFKVMPKTKGYDSGCSKYLIKFHDVKNEPERVDGEDVVKTEYSKDDKILSVTMLRKKENQIIRII